MHHSAQPRRAYIRRGADIVQLCTSFNLSFQDCTIPHKTRHHEPGARNFFSTKHHPVRSLVFWLEFTPRSRLLEFFLRPRHTRGRSPSLLVASSLQNCVVQRPLPNQRPQTPAHPPRRRRARPLRSTGDRESGIEEVGGVAYNPNHATSIRGRWELKRGNPRRNLFRFASKTTRKVLILKHLQ